MMAGQILKVCTYFLISHISTNEDCSQPDHEPTCRVAACPQPVASIESSDPGVKADRVKTETANENTGDGSIAEYVTVKDADDLAIGFDESAARFMPKSTVFFIQVSDPPLVIDRVLNHPVRAKIEALEPVKRFYKSPEFLMVQFGEKYIQWQLGDSWDNLLKKLTDRGLYLGFDAKTQGFVVVFRTSDEAKLNKVAGSLLGFIEKQAKDGDQPVPFKKSKYRGHSTAKFEQMTVARINDWFLISTKDALAKHVADRIIDNDIDTGLSQVPEFLDAAQKAKSHNFLWAYANLKTLRDAGVSKELFAGRTDQPFVELLAGGVLESLKTADYASASVSLGNQGVTLNMSTPFNKSNAAENRAYFFGNDKNGNAPKPLLPENTIANVIAHRDIAQWWLSKESLFDESVIAGLAQADSQLSTMFAGLDFGEEVLGATQPGVQVIVTEQTFENDYQPDVKLPSFALVFRLKESELDIRRRFKIAYQSLLGIVNYSLAQQGNPQLEMVTDKTEQGEIISAEYLLSDDNRKGLINYNFSPSIAFSGEYFVISSTRQLATELSKLAENADPNATIATNTRLTLNAQQLDNILKLNRESFIAQTMIENGQDREAAAEQVDSLLLIPGFFDQATLDLKVNDDSIELSARIDIK